MEFKSQICTTREQSEMLLALGLKKETADMCHQVLTLNGEPVAIISPDVWTGEQEISDSHYPAWSLHRLVEMVPHTIWHTEYEDRPRLKHTFWFSKYAPSYDSTEDIDFRANQDLYNNMIDCIEWLINEGHFSKEYMEDKQ